MTLLAVCVVASAARWLRLGTFWGDAGRWMYEAYRSSAGEHVYAEYMWTYPPLSLWVVAGAFRMFGATFLTAQVVLSIVSTVSVVLMWYAARRLLRPGLALLVALVLAGICASSASDFAFFSLRIYTPALLTGLAGSLLLLIGSLDYMAGAGSRARAYAAMATGAFIALLSKHEFAVAAVATYFAVVLIDRTGPFRDTTAWPWLRRAIVLGALLFVPASVAYAWTGMSVGWRNLGLSMSGYGTVDVACPLWPTGLGVFGAIAALAQAVLMVTAASVVACVVRRRAPTRAELLLWVGGIASAVVIAAYMPYAVDNYPPNALGMLGGAVSYLLSLRGFFIPAMWLALIGVAITGWRMLIAVVRRDPVDPETARYFLVVSVAAALCVRSMFGGTLANLSTTPIGAVPFLLLFAVVLIERVFSRPGDRILLWTDAVQARTVRTSLIGLIVGYAAVKTAASLAFASRQDYERLETRSGRVVLNDGGLSRDVYRYVEEHTDPEDRILDIPYSGGTSFASRRRSPIFSTLLLAQRLPEDLLQRDRDQLATRGAALVIVPDLPDFGSYYGLNPKLGCTFPRLAWEFEPDPALVVPRQPVIDYVAANYVEQARFRHIRILAPR